jgi:hypothetical protein
MSALYSESHRAWKDTFDRRKLADFLEDTIVHAEIAAEGRNSVANAGGTIGRSEYAVRIAAGDP